MIPDPSTIPARNALVGYAAKRVDAVVIAPLKLASADDAVLLKAEQLLAGLRAHFAKHGIVLGELRAENGEIIVDITPAP